MRSWVPSTGNKGLGIVYWCIEKDIMNHCSVLGHWIGCCTLLLCCSSCIFCNCKLLKKKKSSETIWWLFHNFPLLLLLICTSGCYWSCCLYCDSCQRRQRIHYRCLHCLSHFLSNGRQNYHILRRRAIARGTKLFSEKIKKGPILSSLITCIISINNVQKLVPRRI